MWDRTIGRKRFRTYQDVDESFPSQDNGRAAAPDPRRTESAPLIIDCCMKFGRVAKTGTFENERVTR
ncbi:hypothetical protein VTP01DRAFT_5500 [Rhizomucor pusillus]|uniref:uncharacterized protein n=1 Tax=Rhizomucor pusillus TaxID=4840 RepID=UPI0037432B27